MLGWQYLSAPNDNAFCLQHRNTFSATCMLSRRPGARAVVVNEEPQLWTVSDLKMTLFALSLPVSRGLTQDSPREDVTLSTHRENLQGVSVRAAGEHFCRHQLQMDTSIVLRLSLWRTWQMFSTSHLIFFCPVVISSELCGSYEGPHLGFCTCTFLNNTGSHSKCSFSSKNDNFKILSFWVLPFLTAFSIGSMTLSQLIALNLSDSMGGVNHIKYNGVRNDHNTPT